MSYSDCLLFRGQPTKVQPGDLLRISLADASISFLRNNELMDIRLARDELVQSFLHYGEPKVLRGMNHVAVAGDVARQVDLFVKRIRQEQDYMVYEFG